MCTRTVLSLEESQQRDLGDGPAAGSSSQDEDNEEGGRGRDGGESNDDLGGYMSGLEEHKVRHGGLFHTQPALYAHMCIQLMT